MYCSQPASFVDSARPGMVRKLNRSLYGLKQVSRAWYSCFASYLVSIGFVKTKSNTPLFIHRRDDDTIYLLYIEDIVLMVSSATLLQCTIAAPIA